ncbi:MAG: spermidine/putrescine ABC transporter substrate-binding protein [Gemmatimonadales bacterium]
MADETAIRALLERLERGTISRREFVGRATALGLGLSTASVILAGCGRDKGGNGDGGDLGPLEKELNVYNWSDYIAADTIPNFEREFGVKVTYDTYESNEELLEKLRAGSAGYDIVVPSNYVVPVMTASNLAAELNRKYLPNLGNLAPTFVNPVFDPGNRHAIPYQWGTTGFAYRTDKIPQAADSWSIFLDPRYQGKMTQMDDMREVVGSWLRYRGHSLNSVDPAELSAARADALAARKNLKAYISAPVKGQLISGEVWVAQLWNGDTEQARAEEPAIGYVLPKEGCTIWTDSIVIPATAPHKRAAHEFINYLLRPEVGAAISNFTGYGTPNQAALSQMTRPVPYPTAEEFQRLEYQKDLGSADGLWTKLWQEVRSA